MIGIVLKSIGYIGLKEKKLLLVLKKEGKMFFCIVYF